MLLEKIQIETILPCHLHPERIKVIGRTENDIGSFMPQLVTYLKKNVRGVLYNKGAGSVTFKRDLHIFTIHNQKVAITYLEDTEQAEAFFAWAIDTINAAYALQDQLEPTLESNKPLTPFDIYPYLPQTNCRRCGQLTCLAFATKLAREEASIEKCGVLHDEGMQEKRAALLEKLEAAGYGLLEAE